MSILITGADGFIGGYLQSYLRTRVDHVNSTTYETVNLSDPKSFDSFISNVSQKPTMLVHCASAARASGFGYDQDCFTNNISMFVNLLKYCMANDCFLINLASGSDVDRSFWSDSMDEYMYIRHMPSISDIHGYSKNIISTMAGLACYKKILNLRLFGVFGEGENYLQKIVPNTIAKCLHGINPLIIRDRLYDYVDVLDLSRFILYLYKRLSSNDSSLPLLISSPLDINFSTGSPKSLLSIVKYLATSINKQLNVSVLHQDMGLAYCGDNTRFNLMFRDFSFSNFNESLDRQIIYYSSAFDTFSKEALEKDEFIKYAKKIS